MCTYNVFLCIRLFKKLQLKLILIQIRLKLHLYTYYALFYLFDAVCTNINIKCIYCNCIVNRILNERKQNDKKYRMCLYNQLIRSFIHSFAIPSLTHTSHQVKLLSSIQVETLTECEMEKYVDCVICCMNIYRKAH